MKREHILLLSYLFGQQKTSRALILGLEITTLTGEIRS